MDPSVSMALANKSLFFLPAVTVTVTVLVVVAVATGVTVAMVDVTGVVTVLVVVLVIVEGAAVAVTVAAHGEIVVAKKLLQSADPTAGPGAALLATTCL